jgi:phosphoglycolate phosphatase
MIGDTEFDMQMANNANTHSLAVSYGVHERERLLHHDPLTCVDNVNQLHSWLAANVIYETQG